MIFIKKLFHCQPPPQRILEDLEKAWLWYMVIQTVVSSFTFVVRFNMSHLSPTKQKWETERNLRIKQCIGL